MYVERAILLARSRFEKAYFIRVQVRLNRLNMIRRSLPSTCTITHGSYDKNTKGPLPLPLVVGSKRWNERSRSLQLAQAN